MNGASADGAPRARRIGLTGGIACGKSLFLRALGREGFLTLDADDIVHEMIPAGERRRLAAEVFADPGARRRLEARIHPAVRERIARFFAGADDPCAKGSGALRIAAVPLLFEAGWRGDFDFVAAVVSSRENQIARMTELRGWTRGEAEARLAAQMPNARKAALADFVVENDSTAAALEKAAAEFARRCGAGGNCRDDRSNTGKEEKT